MGEIGSFLEAIPEDLYVSLGSMKFLGRVAPNPFTSYVCDVISHTRHSKPGMLHILSLLSIDHRVLLNSRTILMQKLTYSLYSSLRGSSRLSVRANRIRQFSNRGRVCVRSKIILVIDSSISFQTFASYINVSVNGHTSIAMKLGTTHCQDCLNASPDQTCNWICVCHAADGVCELLEGLQEGSSGVCQLCERARFLLFRKVGQPYVERCSIKRCRHQILVLAQTLHTEIHRLLPSLSRCIVTGHC